VLLAVLLAGESYRAMLASARLSCPKTYVETSCSTDYILITRTQSAVRAELRGELSLHVGGEWSYTTGFGPFLFL